MRYEILGETLPVVICYLESGEKNGYRRWRNVLDVSKYENGNNFEWRNRKDLWKSVFQEKRCSRMFIQHKAEKG